MKSEIEFPVGEYVDREGDRWHVVAAYSDSRWAMLDGAAYPRGYSVAHLQDFGLKPYVAPVVVERWVNVYKNSTSAFLDSTKQAEYCASPERLGLLKLTFENNKLVKAEVEK